jgi:hypothetical protein
MNTLLGVLTRVCPPCLQRPRFWANGQLVQLLRSTTQGVSAAVSSYANTVAGIINGASSSSPTSSGSSGALFIYNSGTQQVRSCNWHML